MIFAAIVGAVVLAALAAMVWVLYKLMRNWSN